jgi:iron complex outermembrane receptor protein
MAARRSCTRARRYVALCGVLLLAPAAAFAQRGGDALASEEVLFEDIPSVYSASKHEQKVTEAPASVSIVTAEEIRRYGYQTLAEILHHLNGLYVTTDRNYEYLGVRGFGRPRDYNTRMLLLVDGHRVNDAIYGTAPIGQELPIDVAAIERVEVVRGPSSSLYGTSAVFGVINVVTRRGRDLEGGELSGGYGSHGRAGGALRYGVRAEAGVEAMASLSYLASDGERSLYYPEFQRPRFGDGDGVANGADGEHASHFFGQASFAGWSLQAAHGSRKKTIPTAAFGTVFDTAQTFTRDAFSWIDLSRRGEWLGWDLDAALFWDRYRYDGDYLYDYGTLDSPFRVTNRDWAVGERAGARLGASRWFGEHRVTVGANYSDDYRVDQENYDVAPRAVYIEASSSHDEWGVFVQDEVALSDQLSLSAGVRYDDYDLFGSSWNPRAALIWSPLERTTLKAIYGTAFRAPTAYEVYYVPPKGDAASLDPETNEMTELVWEQSSASGWRGTLSLYRYTVEDLIDVDPDSSVVYQQLANLQTARAGGVEAGVEKRFDGGAEVHASYAWQRAENRDGCLTNSPAHMAALGFSAPLPGERLWLAAEARYLSSRETGVGPDVGSMFTADVSLSADRLWRGLGFTLSVKNAFDRENDDAGAADTRQLRIERPGRQLWLELRYELPGPP